MNAKIKRKQGKQGKQGMHISKVSLLTIIVVLISSTNVLASESSSNWFAGSGVTIGSFLDERRDVSNSARGVELHGGYQLGKYLKLMVGVNTFSVSNSNTSSSIDNVSAIFAVIRPQWEFDSGFLVYFDLGASSTNRGDGGKVGIGLGYNEGNHEIAVGLDITIIDAKDTVGGVALQYYYHF